MGFDDPELIPGDIQYLTTDVFRGYQNRRKPDLGAFAGMKNLSSRDYPLLSARGKREVAAASPSLGGLLGKDGLCYTDGRELVVGEHRYDLGLSAEQPKRLISMGAYVVIFPDKKFLNTADPQERGELEQVFTAEEVSLCPCNRDGQPRNPGYVQSSPPEEPENMALWLDNATREGSLKQFSAATGQWISITQVYVRLEAAGIEEAFRSGDAVEITGLTGKGESMNGTAVLHTVGTGFAVISGLLDKRTALPGRVRMERRVPEMDLVIECNNRLWGCRYGLNRAGKFVNEIYASKLGDFRNWAYFAGTAADSYAVSLGSDGGFTGAVNYLGYPLFFRENCLHKIFGSYPAEYRLQTTPCRGVQAGSAESLTLAEEILYYKSPEGVCAFDGSLPVQVGQDLGQTRYENAAGGGVDGRFYLSMKGPEGWVLAVYDTRRRMWHLEDDLHIRSFARWGRNLYGLEPETGRLWRLAGEADDPDISWMAQTGILDGGTPDAKFLSGLGVRMQLNPGSRVEFLLRYDSQGDWISAGTAVGTGLGIFTLPIRPRRCDHLELKIRGTGPARIYALTRAMEKGEAIL